MKLYLHNVIHSFHLVFASQLYPAVINAKHGTGAENVAAAMATLHPGYCCRGVSLVPGDSHIGAQPAIG